ncbi:MAG: hypothetical protein ABFC89_10635 [Methanospirillum sp.]
MRDTTADTGDADGAPRQALPENTLIYLGRSMSPTFADLDLLTYAPDDPVRPGDVIAFRRPDRDQVIVHRAIATDGAAITTQGDGNALPDPSAVERNRVIGVVRSRQRNRERSPVRGGWWGLARFRYLRERRRVVRSCVRLAAPGYRLLVRHRLVSRIGTRILPWEIRRVVRSDGIEERLWCFGRLAGIRSPGSLRWRLAAPFPALIDATLLPVHETVRDAREE